MTFCGIILRYFRKLTTLNYFKFKKILVASSFGEGVTLYCALRDIKRWI
jgi:hypothetical protein